MLGEVERACKNRNLELLRESVKRLEREVGSSGGERIIVFLKAGVKTLEVHPSEAVWKFCEERIRELKEVFKRKFP